MISFLLDCPLRRAPLIQFLLSLWCHWSVCCHQFAILENWNGSLFMSHSLLISISLSIPSMLCHGMLHFEGIAHCLPRLCALRLRHQQKFFRCKDRKKKISSVMRRSGTCKSTFRRRQSRTTTKLLSRWVFMIFMLKQKHEKVETLCPCESQ